jgi:hypothetical protein
MYNKLFTKILDSSIWLASDPQRIVWITLIAAMDRHGIAQFACVENLAARARVSIKDTAKAVKAFESPDPHAPTQEYEGRRIERLDGGWLVLNAQKYKDMVTAASAAEKTRERVRKHREAKRVTECNAVKRLVTPSEQIKANNLKSERPLETVFEREVSKSARERLPQFSNLVEKLKS